MGPDGSGEPETEEVWSPLRAWLAKDAGRRVLLAGYALIAFQALLRGWSKFGGWFVGDDFSFIGRALTMPVWSGRYLLEGWNGHFMPGAFLQVKALVDLWPYNPVPVAIVDLVLQAVITYLLLRLLVNLFGARTEILIPLTMFALTPMTLPAFLWWAAALNQLWGQLAMVLVLTAQLSYHRTGRLSRAYLGVASMAGGLLFSEKLLLMLPVVFAFTFLWFTPGAPVRRLRRCLLEHRWVWLAYLAVGVAYLVYYKLAVPPPLGKPGAFTVTVQTVVSGIGTAILPAVFGGPFNWRPLEIGGVADPGAAMVTIFAIISVLLVWLTVWRRVRASFGWLVVLSYIVLNASILGFTRATYVGPLIGSEYRYHTDVALILAVFGSLAVLPVTGPFRAGRFQALLPRGGQPSLPRGSRGRGSFDGKPVAGLASMAIGMVVLLLVVTSSISTIRFDPLWRNNTARAYYENVQSSIAGTKAHITIADVPIAFLAYTNSSDMFGVFQPKPRFLTKGESTDHLFTPDPSGRLREVKVNGFKNVPGPESANGCGWRIGKDPVTVPLGAKTLPWLWTARIGYMATYANDATVTVGSVTSKVHFEPGLHQLFVVGDGAVDAVRFSGVGYGSVCTNDIEVGFLDVVPDTSPAGVYGSARR